MSIPVGVIMLWFGAIVDIPAGWAHCDGNNGTPDLRDKFVPGAGTTYNPGDTGGAVSHNHTFTSNGHTHEAVAGTDIAAGADIDTLSDSQTDSGTTSTDNHLPPYHALAYIMRV